MYAKEFFEEYNQSNNKAKCAEKHIVRTYIPYAEKLTLVNKVLRASMYQEVNGAETFVRDTAVCYYLFVMAMIEAYTDIRFNDGGTNNEHQNIESFDLFEESGATEIFVQAIGEDTNKLNTVMKMKTDDMMDAERSLVPFLDTKIQAWQTGMNFLGEALEKVQLNNHEVE